MGKKDKYAEKKKPVASAPEAAATQPMPSTSAASAPQQSAPFVAVSTPTNDYEPLRAANIKDAMQRFQGTKGRKCNLEVNMMPLDTKKLVKQVFHYDVSITPARPKKFLPQVLRQFLGANFPGVFYSFDAFANEQNEGTVRTNVYIGHALRIDGDDLSGKTTIDNREFTVTIKIAGNPIDMSGLNGNIADQRALQCLDIAIRSVFRDVLDRGDAISAGRRIFFPNLAFDLNDRNELYQKVKIFPGLFQSALICRSGLFLNLDITHKAFRVDRSILDYVAFLWNKNPNQLTAKDIYDCEREFHGLSIDCQILGTSRVRLQKFLKFANPKQDFPLEENGQKKGRIGVHAYYKQNKKYNVQYPNFPLVQVGTADKDLYFPIELCKIARQAVQCDIVSETAMKPADRKARIISVGTNLPYHESKVIESFGLNMTSSFVKNFGKCNGRILDAPKLKYQNKVVDVSNGVWNGETFLQTGEMTSGLMWAVLSTTNTNSTQIQTLVKEIFSKAKAKNINLSQSPKITDHMKDCQIRDIASKLAELKAQGYGLVFTIFDDRNNGNYSAVKRAAELESSKIHIMTQCLRNSTLRKMFNDRNQRVVSFRGQVIENLLLKDNEKLNGTNYTIVDAAFQRHLGTMYIGADVNHPGSKLKPSVVGICASDDLYGMRYNMIYKYQKPRQEMIDGFEEDIKVLLERYKAKNGRYPDKIMYYRDGVSEGQFEQVLSHEWVEMKKGVAAVYKGAPHPRMAFICVQKRHNVRLFTVDKNCDRNGNILPGTCVDTDIVHPTYYQFYLASHAAIQGTTRPAKYCVLKDEIGMSVDDLQAITHDLCHAFVRCTRAVSYPAPTYYSHLVAKRAEAYLDHTYLVKEELMQPNFENELRREIAALNNSLRVSQDFINKTQMYFI